jgi:ActR/RegA family two-component response regulator
VDNIRWERLRDKFFKECTNNIEETGLYEIRRVNMAPNDLFKWFKKEIIDEQRDKKAAQFK